MTSDVISDILAAFESDAGGAADLAALADAFVDASPADRVSALAGLLDAARRVRRCHERYDNQFRNAYRVSSLELEDDRLSEDNRRHVERYQREAVVRKLTESIEDGHWYAVRIDRDRSAEPGGSGRYAVRVVARVAPLDGGAVKTD